MARAQLRFTPCERFALQLFRLAARGGAAAALQTSNVSVRQFVKSLRYANYHIQYIYIYIYIDTGQALTCSLFYAVARRLSARTVGIIIPGHN